MYTIFDVDDDDGGFPAEPVGSPAFWWKLGVSVVLVLLGGVFAGAHTHSPSSFFSIGSTDVYVFRANAGASESG